MRVILQLAAFTSCLAAVLAGNPTRAQVQPTTFPPTAVASSSEYSNCTVPSQVTFRLEDVNAPWYPSSWKTVRYLMFPGQTTLTKMVPAPGSGATTGKNPEMNTGAGPRQAENCAPAGATQYMSFRVKTTNYFSQPGGGTVAGNHLVFGWRSAASATTVDTIALILHVNHPSGLGSGFFPERIRIGLGAGDLPAVPPVTASDGTPFPAQDGITYFVEALADQTGIAYHIANVGTGKSSNWIRYSNPASIPPAVGTGIAFGSICADADLSGSCEPFNYQTQSPHKVEIWDITAN